VRVPPKISRPQRLRLRNPHSRRKASFWASKKEEKNLVDFNNSLKASNLNHRAKASRCSRIFNVETGRAKIT
jgi:hypothetical protein